MNKIECIVMDWAGSAVDYGCFAPVAAFIGSMDEIGIELSATDARKPMGLNKIDHIKALFQMPHISAQFERGYGRQVNDDDIQARYESFKKILFGSLAQYTDPIPGVVEVIGKLQERGIKIGSTTGYTDEMMNIVAPAAAEKGYCPDLWVTADHLPAGRPYPYMIYSNMCQLAIPSVRNVIKYGDTVADMREGVAAGVWTVGVVTGSNELALTEEEVDAMAPAELNRRKLEVRMRLLAAGAHYVVDNIRELPMLIDAIDRRMANGQA